MKLPSSEEIDAMGQEQLIKLVSIIIPQYLKLEHGIIDIHQYLRVKKEDGKKLISINRVRKKISKLF